MTSRGTGALPDCNYSLVRSTYLAQEPGSGSRAPGHRGRHHSFLYLPGVLDCGAVVVVVVASAVPVVGDYLLTVDQQATTLFLRQLSAPHARSTGVAAGTRPALFTCSDGSNRSTLGCYPQHMPPVLHTLIHRRWRPFGRHDFVLQWDQAMHQQPKLLNKNEPGDQLCLFTSTAGSSQTT
jgi:hypothetical protein